MIAALRAQEQAGADLVTDGEQRRDNFYSFVVDKLNGMKLMSVADLFDIDGLPITAIPDEITVAPTGTTDGMAALGAVHDLGGGHYSFDVTATHVQGYGTWSVTARYGTKFVRLWPDLVILFTQP